MQTWYFEDIIFLVLNILSIIFIVFFFWSLITKKSVLHQGLTLIFLGALLSVLLVFTSKQSLIEKEIIEWITFSLIIISLSAGAVLVTNELRKKNS